MLLITFLDYFYKILLNNYCRKLNKINLGDWWIMLLHHIGLPPAIDRRLRLQVSGNSLNKVLIARGNKQ